VVGLRRSLLLIAEVIAVSDFGQSDGTGVGDCFEDRNAVVVCAVHDVSIPSAITAQPTVRRSEYPFLDSARFAADSL
jgi:hypothetical protein